jgi:2,3,4,5-tetrahydropyridine-2-carboxylate N-succinyltransferase
MTNLQSIIENAWDNRELLQEDTTQKAIREVVELLDNGTLRVAEPVANGWQVNEWVKKAVVMYFPIQKMETLEAGIFEYHDKIPLKRNFAERGIRVVPNAVARHGAYISSGVILMPSYVNIGAYVDEGTMVDTWATVGEVSHIASKSRVICGSEGEVNTPQLVCSVVASIVVLTEDERKQTNLTNDVLPVTSISTF